MVGIAGTALGELLGAGLNEVAAAVGNGWSMDACVAVLGKLLDANGLNGCKVAVAVAWTGAGEGG